jgi:hypothetical protein
MAPDLVVQELLDLTRVRAAGEPSSAGRNHAVVLVGICFRIEDADEVPFVQQPPKLSHSIAHEAMITWTPAAMAA